MAQREDSIVRISKANYKKLQALMLDLKEESWDGKIAGRKPTLNQMMEKLLDSMDTVKSGEIYYLVAGKAFADVSVARGEAIMEAVKSKSIPMWPSVAVVIGEDSGG